MEKTYWQRVHALALQRSTEALGLDGGVKVVIRLILAVMALAALWLLDSSQAAQIDLKVRVAGTVVIALMFPAVYLWKRMWAHKRLYDEASSRADDLGSKVAELERAGPKLVFRIDHVLSGGQRRQDDGPVIDNEQVIVEVRVLNQGSMASVALDWNMTFVASGEVIPGRIEHQKNLTIDRGDVRIEYHEGQSIYERTETPVPPGGGTAGFLVAEFPAGTVARAVAGDTLRVAATDVLGRNVQAEYTMTMTDGGTRYFPGRAASVVKPQGGSPNGD